jgi:hypothetical protein
MLERLQQQFSETYQADHGYDVRDFLVTDVRMAKALGGDNVLTNSGETLLVAEDDDGLAMSLFLEADMIERLESQDPTEQLDHHQLDDLCKVIEGLSHFNYVAWRAGRDRSVSLLELELQAEVDKYVSTVQLAREQRDTDMLHSLHGRLFNDIRLRDELDAEQEERYREAAEYAARFCRAIRSRLIERGDDALAELRSFYRMPLRDKISHIHTRAWVTN